MNNNEGLNILVCGSSRFEDKAFVFGMLDQFYNQCGARLSSIATSKFSGACEFCREWIQIKNEEIKLNSKTSHLIKEINCTFDMLLEENNSSFYEHANIPDSILEKDDFFNKGKELLLKNKIHFILAFPNPEGELGPSTVNIKRFAKLAGLGNMVLDCNLALKKALTLKEETKKPIINDDDEFNNIHPTTKHKI